MDVRDAAGFFVSGLQSSNLTLVEDGNQINTVELSEQRPGGQFVVAFNPSPGYAIRDSQGFTRFDYITQAMQTWMGAISAQPIDDLSLISPRGSLASHISDPNAWLGGWASIDANFETAAPGLDVLSNAIDVASDPNSDPNRGRAVLFITPILDETLITNVQSLADRARQANVRVYVWLIDSPNLFESNMAVALSNLSLATGGQYLTFSGVEDLPEWNTLVESVRRIYRLEYLSRINTAGTHELIAQVSAGQIEVVSAPLNYELALQPPNAAFISPPPQIVRAIPLDKDIAVENLEPRTATLEILVEFPDTITREIVHSALYVNGELAVENNEPPFDTFTFDLTAYDASSMLSVHAEVTDELGLSGSSIETPIQLTVQRPQQGVLALMSRNIGTIAVLLALLAGGVLLVVLVLAGRLRPRTLGEITRPLKENTDPVTQPVRVKDEPPSRPLPEAPGNRIRRLAQRITSTRMPWGQRRSDPQPYGFLVPITDDGEPTGEDIHPIFDREIIFGSDPGQASLALEDASVEPAHARLWRDDKGRFRLADQGSVAGTWLNYAPVSEEGSPVEHGDLLHIAKVGFRFTLTEPKLTRKVLVIPKNPSKPTDEIGA